MAICIQENGAGCLKLLDKGMKAKDFVCPRCMRAQRKPMPVRHPYPLRFPILIHVSLVQGRRLHTQSQVLTAYHEPALGGIFEPRQRVNLL